MLMQGVSLLGRCRATDAFVKREVSQMSLKCAVAEDVLKAIKDNKVQMIDLRFTDLPGTWQHFSRRPQNPTGSKTTIDYSARD